MDCIRHSEIAERARPGSDRVDQKRELAGGSEAEAHGPWEQPPGRLEHEELARDTRVESTPLEPQERVRPNPFAADRRESLAPGTGPAK